ncbi:protein S100-P isoform X1 [Haemorhous mexicanus]|uniref:protein S100-P isoform X1 n=1 Tax=Haemorhous mexicanus TaxID=30427 RepID=UPI0028BE5DC3|nr:protein S100-P isoform X1 [Haemorhous mexicanus]
MSQLETAMGMTIAVFDQYARTDGNRQTLSKAELKTLLEKELPNFLEFIQTSYGPLKNTTALLLLLLVPHEAQEQEWHSYGGCRMLGRTELSLSLHAPSSEERHSSASFSGPGSPAASRCEGRSSAGVHLQCLC